ncbi:hypothetical protein VTK73DRAFT_9729 [Phialemonium thermophilum]|uniref:Uncharacterized protein n=1 Tax=Phialemonium thermophilum TaxID=223376 RepID=A0ABR3W0R3_9PEZI
MDRTLSMSSTRLCRDIGGPKVLRSREVVPDGRGVGRTRCSYLANIVHVPVLTHLGPCVGIPSERSRHSLAPLVTSFELEFGLEYTRRAKAQPILVRAGGRELEPAWLSNLEFSLVGSRGIQSGQAQILLCVKRSAVTFRGSSNNQKTRQRRAALPCASISCAHARSCSE